MHVAESFRAMKNPPEVPSLPEGSASMNLFGAEGSAKNKWSLGFLKSILVGLQPVVALQMESRYHCFQFLCTRPEGSLWLSKTDESNMNNQIGRLIFLVWTDLKPWAVKKNLHLK